MDFLFLSLFSLLGPLLLVGFFCHPRLPALLLFSDLDVAWGKSVRTSVVSLRYSLWKIFIFFTTSSWKQISAWSTPLQTP